MLPIILLLVMFGVGVSDLSAYAKGYKVSRPRLPKMPRPHKPR